MIITETITVGDRQLVKTYSDSGRYVVRDGFEYEEAIDPIDSGRVYEEGSLIPHEDEDEPTAEEILDILLGGET